MKKLTNDDSDSDSDREEANKNRQNKTRINGKTNKNIRNKTGIDGKARNKTTSVVGKMNKNSSNKIGNNGKANKNILSKTKGNGKMNKNILNKTKGNGKTNKNINKIHNNGKANKKSEFNCSKCGLIFKREIELTKHLELAKIDSSIHPVYTCLYCDLNFFQKSRLEKHTTNMHARKNNYTSRGYFRKPVDCMCCEMKFDLGDDLINHLKEDHHIETEKPYGCKACNKFYDKPYKLNDHIKIYHPDDENEEENLKILQDAAEMNDGEMTYLCKLCNRRSFTATEFLVHQRYHNAPKEFICDYCGVQKRTKYGLQKHIIALHLNLRTFLCDLCDKSFCTKYERDLHRRIHTGEKPFSCPICEKTCVSSSHLAQHKKTHSTDILLHDCMYCEKKFRHKGSLINHIRTHTGEKPFKCHLCTKSYATRNRHTHHMMVTHSNSRPFTCQICGSSFKTNEYLRRHLHLHETKIDVQFRRTRGASPNKKRIRKRPSEKQFQCHLCEKSFAMRYELSYHLNVTHSENRPYTCQICGNLFKTNKFLNRHLKLHERKPNAKIRRTRGLNKMNNKKKSKQQQNIIESDPLIIRGTGSSKQYNYPTEGDEIIHLHHHMDCDISSHLTASTSGPSERYSIQENTDSFKTPVGPTDLSCYNNMLGGNSDYQYELASSFISRPDGVQVVQFRRKGDS